ncbi:(2Fe-2S)-binding protein [Spectribacter hydrogenooxidans]|uniref:(2Fe-2S)-binding protein n=1 Tax=Spectribacter hydrogenoxidans TaxID=3075608 RepID=A0ABU3C431_9GAMM|nr:2Fe-2S iron-sulfur cluster-binding protein [Salinisphaera sp. W335]MDT0636094.1 (2Fe-2S)-binding protein [Salinisphaera sp. W335]
MKLNINGTAHNVDVPKNMPLLWVLRDRLGLTGTKFGCGVAQCGACTVHVDGQPKRSCVTPVKFLGNSKITTIEGLDSPQAKAIQDAWCAIDVPQCGFCQSGQVMTATGLLTEKPNPTDDDIDGALTGNICRCATYVRIRQAVHDAAEQLAG